jgi:predicted RNase H-like nuclease
MFVAGVDGCHAGGIAFMVELPSRVTSAEVIDLPEWLRRRPPDLACFAIDIPVGLLYGSRACDKEARKLLGQPTAKSPIIRRSRAKDNEKVIYDPPWGSSCPSLFNPESRLRL